MKMVGGPKERIILLKAEVIDYGKEYRVVMILR